MVSTARLGRPSSSLGRPRSLGRPPTFNAICLDAAEFYFFNINPGIRLDEEADPAPLDLINLPYLSIERPFLSFRQTAVEYLIGRLSIGKKNL